MRPGITEYCVPAWSPHYEKDKLLLERVQQHFTRMVPGLRQLTYEQRLKRLGLWTLEERRNRADLPSVMFRQHVAIQLQLSRVTVIWTYVDSFSHSELLADGMVYHKASSAAIRSTSSRMVSVQRGRSRWATSRTK